MTFCADDGFWPGAIFHGMPLSPRNTRFRPAIVIMAERMIILNEIESSGSRRDACTMGQTAKKPSSARPSARMPMRAISGGWADASDGLDAAFGAAVA